MSTRLVPMDDNTWQNLKKTAMGNFRTQCKNWTVDRLNGSAPPLSDDVKEKLVTALGDMMDDLKYMEENREKLNNIKAMSLSKPLAGAHRGEATLLRHMLARSVSAIKLHGDLMLEPEIRAFVDATTREAKRISYLDDISRGLMGSVIRAAVKASPHVQQPIGLINLPY